MKRRRSRALWWGVAATALGLGCGGRSTLDANDGSPTPTRAADAAVEPQDSAIGVGPGDASTSSGLPGDASTSSASPRDAGCLSDILSFDPSTAAFQACWSCAKKVCASPLAACAADCQCNGIVASALMCTEDGLSLETCFQATFGSSGDPAEANAESCLEQQAYGACNCAAVVATDAGTSDASTATGGGGQVTDDSCSFTMAETSAGVDYEVTCSCPEAACVCFGPTTHVVQYAGCPACPGQQGTNPGEVFALCGFPLYP